MELSDQYCMHINGTTQANKYPKHQLCFQIKREYGLTPFRLIKSTNALSYQFHESFLNKTDENIEF